MTQYRSIAELIHDAGGAIAISEASGPADGNGARPLTRDAVYKWPKTGIPDRHWHLIISLTLTTPDELFAANCAIRKERAKEAAE